MSCATPLEYVRDLPPFVQENVCKLLEEDRAWEGVVKRFQDMKINIISIEKLNQEKEPSSPPQKLFEFLIHPNFKGGYLKLSALYRIAGTLNLHKVMLCLKPYVSAEDIKKVGDAMKQSTASCASSQNDTEISYIHNLPNNVRSQLCTVLDSDGSWKRLMARFEKAGFNYYSIELCQMDSPTSATSELLKLLGDRNFKISLLYAALASLRLTKAMSLLQCYVSENLVSITTLPDSRNNISKENNVRSRVAVCVRSPSMITPQDLENDAILEVNTLEPAQTFFNSQDGWNGISYRELEEATNEWSVENRLGLKSTGNFYYGVLNKTQKVAIKRLRLKDKNQSIQVLKELRQLCSAKKHDNILKMLMFTEGNGDNNPCLIYPFKEHRSLYDHLLNRSKEPKCSLVKSDVRNICWRDRQNIALRVAEALQHLHDCFECAVVVKSTDILLTDSMEPLVVDVCLPCTLKENDSKDVALYLPMQGKGSNRSFCLGVILLELFMGKPADMLGKHPSQFSNRRKIIIDNEFGKLEDKVQMTWKTSIVACFVGAYISHIICELQD